MSPQEINTLSHAFYPDYRPFALTLTRDEDRAMDLLQEAIYLILKNHERFVSGTNIQAWIKTIIRNVFITDYRKAKRRLEIVTEDVPTTNWANRTIAENPALADLSAEDIMTRVEALSPIYRRAFKLYNNGLKYQEIANVTGVPIGTAKSRVWTARQQLRTV
ncbi:RNA polymerase sigma factor [Neolewinella antarctica]|uniref:RNA polymerase sigma-70 factor (ECF subfamily) n=1 Tax=Neolewinella antarctica TaxID=442734 RepID=A0ABX0XG41_9BACT|nr:RNA polymerase sigma factor [Neolewinella antarctica]NJC27874.1 RNA polymerase sigma-70 factor (ECF subfamily) [Neolewinella antarctica]